MSEYSESSMVALLPVETDWCRIELPHLTVVYLGNTFELPTSTKNELLKTVAAFSFDYGPLEIPTTGINVFGEAPDEVEVITLTKTKELSQMRDSVARWNASRYKDFKPHCTVGPIGSIVGNIPQKIVFDRVALFFGAEPIIHWLNKNKI